MRGAFSRVQSSVIQPPCSSSALWRHIVRFLRTQHQSDWSCSRKFKISTSVHSFYLIWLQFRYTNICFFVWISTIGAPRLSSDYSWYLYKFTFCLPHVSFDYTFKVYPSFYVVDGLQVYVTCFLRYKRINYSE